MANNFWYYPLDGAPSIVDAEMGVGIGSGEGGFYIDLAFSEDVYGANDGSSAVTASQFDFLRLHEVTYPDSHPFANPSSNTTVILPTPTKVTNLDGSDLAGGADAIRLHYPASEHPNQRTLTDDTKLTAIGIRTPEGSGIFDGEGTPNELHGGSDWHMLVYHDRFAPYISAANVALGSGRIALTFSEPVKFGIEFNAAEPATPTITNTEPSPKDFTITHYDESEGTETSFSPAGVEYSGTLANGLTELTLVMPTDRTYASEDTVDIRIAEQVKEPLFPSLASIFDLTEKKGISSFPRTAAPAQIGSLQLRGRDTYTIQYTQSYTSAPAIADILTGSGTAHSGSVLDVAEGDDASNDGGVLDVRGIVIEIRRTEPDPGTITLQINGGINNTNVGVTFRLEGENSNITSPNNASVLVRFADGELVKKVAVRVEGNNGPTGTRRYTLALSSTNTATQQIGSPASVNLTISEDDDQTPPDVPGTGSLEIVSFGATEVTLGWQEGTDVNMLRYTLRVTEIGGQGASATLNFVQTPVTSPARVERTFTRTDVVLIPGRTYSFALSVQDVFDNPTVPIAYTPSVMETMLTTFAAGERDRYVNLTCSGGEFGDADGDGVPNNIENEIGSDCTDGGISRIGPADASVPTITVDGGMIAAGAQEVLDGAYIVVPGTGERTGIDPAAATCADCAEDSVRAYVNTSSCRNNPGQARPGGDESVCPTSLSSFLNNDLIILWVGRDSLGNWISTTSTHNVYVAPPVGFDVGVVSVDADQMSVGLPISVAVSPGAGDFSIINNDFLLLGIPLEMQRDFAVLSQDNRKTAITVTGNMPISPALMEVRLAATAKIRAASDLLAPLFEDAENTRITEGQLTGRDLFSIGNDRVLITVRPELRDADSSFTTTFENAGDTSAVTEEASTRISVPESSTVRSGVYITLGEESAGDILLSDNAPVILAALEAEIEITTETGVFDYAIDLENSGDIATVLLRLKAPAPNPSAVYKFDTIENMWMPFLAMETGVNRYDRVYSAQAHDGQCPELNGSRQPDPGGADSGEAWHLAVLNNNFVREGDECLLVQIQDGSDNDADRGVNSVIYDPIGLVAGAGGGGGGGGGGAMSPIWLILLALAMMLPYGLRRRRSSPFISNL